MYIVLLVVASHGMDGVGMASSGQPNGQRRIYRPKGIMTVLIGVDIGSHMATDSPNLPRHGEYGVAVLEMHELDLEPWCPESDYERAADSVSTAKSSGFSESVENIDGREGGDGIGNAYRWEWECLDGVVLVEGLGDRV